MNVVTIKHDFVTVSRYTSANFAIVVSPKFFKVMQAIKRAAIPVVKRKKIAGVDIVLNVGFEDALIRFGIMIFLPVLLFFVDEHLIIYSAPVMAYLFISAITHFCIFKYAWRRYVKHEPPPVQPPYGQDPNYPEQSV